MNRRMYLLGLLAALALALVVANLVVWAGDDSEDGAGARAVAQRAAVAFFTLDHAKPEESVDAVLSLATGAFKKEYAAKKAEIVSGVKDKELVVTASVPDDGAALEYLSADQAQVLVAVDVSSKSKDAAEDARYRTRIDLDLVDGEWLVSGLEQVG